MSLLTHPDLFDLSPIPILCEDWSGVRQDVVALQAQGVEDFGRFLLDNPRFVHDVRRKHRIVDANPKALELLGVPSIEVLGERVAELLPADPVSNGQVLRAIAARAGYCEGERLLRRRDGPDVPIIWRSNLPQGEDGFDRLYFFAFDITEHKRAQEALTEARANLAHAGRLSMVGEMTASLAHEVAQPISSIASNAAAGRRWLGRGAHENVATVLGRIGANAEHAGQIVRRIKDFSRRGQAKLDALAPRDLILQAIALTEHEARRHGAALEIVAPPDLGPVLADRIQVQQVLVNVIMNGLQAVAGLTDGPRRVRVLAEEGAGGEIRFQVEDSGPGVAQADLERIFEPFYTTKPEGVGLGLAISRRIIDEHDGRLSVASGPHGATFSFSLPLAPKAG